ncbi:MAG: hypothetical protein WCP10_04605 [Desulfuromonadales bacterium]
MQYSKSAGYSGTVGVWSGLCIPESLLKLSSLLNLWYHAQQNCFGVWRPAQYGFVIRRVFVVFIPLYEVQGSWIQNRL